MTSAKLRQVYSIDSVDVRITRTAPPWVFLQALGRAPTTGWTEGQFSKRAFALAPEDGIQEFEFIGREPGPDQTVLNVLTPIAGQTEIAKVDLENYWGPSKPLKGIRVHATANSKTVNIVGRDESLRLRAAMTPMATETHFAAPETPGPLHFNEDIKPLFRTYPDVSSMKAIANLDLHNYDDVKANADKILTRLQWNMPCDGRWPEADIAKFEKWKNDGMLK